MAQHSTRADGIPASLEMLERLVAFDTTSLRSNLELIDFAAGWFDDLGASTRLTYDDAGGKANLFATIGPTHLPGIILSGHTDVVPVDGQAWTSDPFRTIIRDDRVYGRGTADMKGFLATILALAPDFAARKLTCPIHFALSYDEEVGCIGVRRLLSDITKRDNKTDLTLMPIRPRLCIVGEPTEMAVIIGHKGKKSVRCTVHGKECHSALNHQGVNAVEIAAEIVTHLRGMQRRIRQNGPFEQGYDPPYTTIHTGTIRGGTALNIVPRECKFDFEIRNLPDHNPEDLMAEIRSLAQDLVPEMLEISDGAGIDFDENNFTAGLNTNREDEAARMACELSGTDETAKVAFTTEAGLFHTAGIPSVVCGPGSIDQAHKPDEFIALSQLAKAEMFIQKLLDRVTQR